MSTLILGGYGNFGARVVRALAEEPTLAPPGLLWIAGRDERRARALAEAVGGPARPLELDASASAAALAEKLAAADVRCVIHTAGPFQRQSYHVAEAAARIGAHYIDLADGRRFVCDFAGRMDSAFRSAGCVGVTGASTVPGLSSAVVDSLTAGWQRVDCIDICIAPAQDAPRGLATLEGVLDYCGAPIDVWLDGRWLQRRGWAAPLPVSVAGLEPRIGALCDIPDLELFPARYDVTRRVMFRAALEIAFTQRGFAVIAAMRACGLLRRPQRLARVLLRAGQLFDRLGTGLGGMSVQVEGLDATDRPARRSWHITAPDNHGPEIPAMPAVLLARAAAKGQIAPGGFTAAGLLRLEDFAPLFARWRMQTRVIDQG